MKKLISVFVLFVSIASAALFAEDVKPGSIKAPSKGKVVLVGRLTFKTPQDFSEYNNICGFTEKQLNLPNYYCIGDSNTMGNRSFELEEPFYYTAKVESDGTVYLPYFQVYLHKSMYDYFNLPLGVKIHIPEGCTYVYVGDFDYDINYALNVTDFNHYDEFEQAQGWINNAVGKECELIRGELEFLQ